MLRSIFVLLTSVLASVAAAQEPSGPPPPSGGKGAAGPEVHELLPDIGKIGAEVAALGGVSWNPHDTGRGWEAAGYIDLPLRRFPGGKISYEIFLGASVAMSDPFTLTDGFGRRSVRTRLRALHASPFGLKYAITRWDVARLRPYLAAGVDVLLTVTEQEPVSGPSIQAPELQARGIRAGQSNMELGGHGAAGAEIRLSPGLSLNLEYRFTATDGMKSRLHTASSALGFHW